MEVLGFLLFLIVGTYAGENEISRDTCETIVINEEMDNFYRELNKDLRKIHSTAYITEPWRFKDKGFWVTTSEIIRLGMDSIIRTGDCTYTVCTLESGEIKVIVRLEFGFSYYNLIIPVLKYGNDTMSASVRIWDNSFVQEVQYVVKDDWCKLKFLSVEMTRADRAIIWSSRPHWDNVDVSETFGITVLPLLNDYYATQLNYNAHLDDQYLFFDCDDVISRRRKKRSPFIGDIIEKSGVISLARKSVDTVSEIFNADKTRKISIDLDLEL